LFFHNRYLKLQTTLHILLVNNDAYPLPRIDDSFDHLSGSCWFSTLDLCSGYWQMECDGSDRHKTAFATMSGLYEYAWQWVCIIDGYRIQTSVVYTEADRSILLSHQDDRR
jgi:hypothetical protein